MDKTIIDLHRYREDKKLFGCLPDDGFIWRCNCGGEHFWISGRGFQCTSCEVTTLFSEWSFYNE